MGAMIGRLQPYPAYKDSGVPWIGEVPIDREDDRVAWGRRAGEAAGKAGIGLGDAVLEVAWQAVGLLRPTLVRDRG